MDISKFSFEHNQEYFDYSVSRLGYILKSMERKGLEKTQEYKELNLAYNLLLQVERKLHKATNYKDVKEGVIERYNEIVKDCFKDVIEVDFNLKLK